MYTIISHNYDYGFRVKRGIASKFRFEAIASCIEQRTNYHDRFKPLHAMRSAPC